MTDYVEKLIQIPYHLPRLSPSEIETYMSLLFCEYYLKENFEGVHQSYVTSRAKDITATFGYQQIEKCLNSANIICPEELQKQLGWCSIVAPALGDVLKGNPRQTKRLLNALVLRRKLAEVAHLTTLSDQVLVKLMLLEYVKPELFTQLYGWQTSQNGVAKEIAELEKFAASSKPSHVGDEPLKKRYGAWMNSNMMQWLKMPPSLTGEDLRPYFWITRDRVAGLLSGVSAMPLHLRTLLTELSEMDSIVPVSAEVVTQIKSLSLDDQQTLLDEITQRFKRAEDKRNLTAAWIFLCSHIPVATASFLTLLEGIPSKALYDTTPTSLVRIVQNQPDHRTQIMQLLRKWSNEKTKVGKLAKEELTELEDGNINRV